MLTISIRLLPLALAALHFLTTRDDVVFQRQRPLLPPVGPLAAARWRPIPTNSWGGYQWRISARRVVRISGNHGDDGRPWWLFVCKNTRHMYERERSAPILPPYPGKYRRSAHGLKLWRCRIERAPYVAVCRRFR